MATLRVSNQSQLNSALKRVGDGDTILLASGTYDKLQMSTSRYSDHDFNQKVTITSENARNPAKINEVILRSVENVEFKNLTFDYVSGRSSSKPFFVENSKDVTFDNVTFDGQTRNGYGVGLGLRVKQSSDITVENSEFINFFNGANFSNSRDINVSNNVVRGISNDGFSFGGITDGVIEDNTFRDYKSPTPRSLHKDSIQFRLAGSENASENIVIRGNSIDSSDVRHAIYIGNEKYKNGDFRAEYKNFLIEDNYIRSAHLHGITMIHGDDVTVRGNTLIHNGDRGYNSSVNMPLINISIYSSDVTITDNRTASVQREQNSSWDVYGNAVGSKQYLHWDGAYGLRASSSAASSASVTSFASQAAPSNDAGDNAGAPAANLRFSGELAKGHTEVHIDNADFSRGDVFVFSKWNSGTFQDNNTGNAIDDWDNRGSARIDSVMDLQELVAFSPSISAKTSGDDLILTIDQGSKGSAEFHFDNLAASFLAAHQPDLF